jgi:OmcA/MtrC family decaheme c-type cytochrome
MIRLFLRSASIIIATLVVAGCGSGSTGAIGPTGPAGPPGPPGTGTGSVITIPANGTPASDAAAAAWAALAPRVTVTSVSINSPPVVNFTVTDGAGMPVAGLGNTSKNSTATLAGLTNLAFSLAKMVPGADGSPSQWVSYMVTSVPTTSAAAAPQRPGTDNTGTLVDHGDGTYTYTYYRDVKQIKTTVDGMTVSGVNNKADLGDLSYDPNLVHRLTIQLSGNAPGTGTNTPNAVEVAGYPGVPLTSPVDVIYDFVPATGQPAANSGRDIVATAKCNECHQKLGGIPGDSPESSGAGFHGGSRNETRYCVVCHTEQRKYGRVEAPFDAATLTFTKPSGCTSTAVDNPDPRCTYRVDDRAVGNMPNNIHKIHMGEFLAKKDYDYGDVRYNEVGFPQDLRNCTKCHDGSATSTAPTAQGDNWKNAPSRRACGACHDGINYATGQGVTIGDALKGAITTTSFPVGVGGFAHGGLAQTDDSQCTTCHTPGNIEFAHLAVTPPNESNSLDVPLVQGETTGNSNTNAAWIASDLSRLPAGAIKVSYDIKSVSRNASKQPVMVFRLLQNGVAVAFNTFNLTLDPDAYINVASQEIWSNYMGAPSVYFVYAVPQDGVTAPADFNGSVSSYLRSIWNGTACWPDPKLAAPVTPPSSCATLSAPDSSGYYTVTFTGLVIPDNAVMLTGGLGFSYNARSSLPLTQTNLPNFPVTLSPLAATQTCTRAPVKTSAPADCSPELLDPRMPNKRGGLIVIAPNGSKVASAGCTSGIAGVCTSAGGYIGRRAIIDDTKCNKCHQELGAFTTEAFHGGQRNDGSTCAWCHNPNRTSSGWSADSTSYVHSIHAGNKRVEPFTWHAGGVGESFKDVKFPGVLKNCEGCHIRGSYDFSASASQSALPSRLYRTVATGIFNGAAGTLTTGCVVTAINDCLQTDVGVYSLSPYVIKDNLTDYGKGFSVAGATGVPTNAAVTTLVNSPIATACFACHDSVLARTHMEINNGSIYKARSSALAAQETCMVCHDTGRIADIKLMHAK